MIILQREPKPLTKTGRGGWFVNFANHRQKEQSWVAYRENIDGGHSIPNFVVVLVAILLINRARLHGHARSPIHPKAVN
jgi:hypothetical protein